MTTAEEMKFNEYKKISAFSCQTENGELPSRREPANGDSASLYLNEEHIDIINIELCENDVLSGEIRSFMNGGGLEFKGLKIEQKITFQEKHIKILALKKEKVGSFRH